MLKDFLPVENVSNDPSVTAILQGVITGFAVAVLFVFFGVTFVVGVVAAVWMLIFCLLFRCICGYGSHLLFWNDNEDCGWSCGCSWCWCH